MECGWHGACEQICTHWPPRSCTHLYAHTCMHMHACTHTHALHSLLSLLKHQVGFRGQRLRNPTNDSNVPNSDLYVWGCGVNQDDGEYKAFELPDPEPLVMELG